MRKKDKPWILTFTAVFLCWLGYVYLSSGNESRLAARLQTDGIASMATITAVRRHLPPRGADGYGEIVYTYRSREGDVHKGKQSVSAVLFERLQYEKQIEVLYDPDRKNKSRLAPEKYPAGEKVK